MSVRPLALMVWLTTAAAGRAADPAPDFNRDVRPILSNNCFLCHGPDEKDRKADLRLDTLAGSRAVGGDGTAAVVPGKPAASELVKRLTATDGLMPPRKSGKALTPREIDILTRWVAAGGKYATHWAYEKPTRPPAPVVTDAAWVRNPVDAFIRARLEREGLTPQPEADRYALARRVALDLTGLPPAVEAVDAFVADGRPDAYERYVDAQLASPAFGEHWARMWLDLARYADSKGYAEDQPRRIWAYRDWVIRAFNGDMPFDRFTVEQLAGDLLPNPTREQLIATAFHRNTTTNTEGGTSDEEFRNAAVVDRVNTTWAVWMGTSMACAQCHNHKYEPLTQADYFRSFAVFNNTADADRADDTPVIELPADPALSAKRAEAERQLAAVDRVANVETGLVQAALRGEQTRLRKRLDALKPESVPVMRELAGPQRRTTKVQVRGNFLQTGDAVTEGVPGVFDPLPTDPPPNRLAFARWLVSPDNPLTARVAVNRLWEQVFGVGLVRTSEEWGSQGEPPSHPELLDWLAVEFQSGVVQGSTKKLLRLLVTSAAYRQGSRVTPAARERDPDNRLVSRGPRVRLSAEMVRDQALAAGGLLSGKMYGPPVRPVRPASGLNAAFGPTLDWQPSPGEDRLRRALYTEWRRTSPYPSLSTFDAPNRDVCAVRRPRTNTPLQALVTLNDQVFVEAAQGLARRMASAGGSASDKARWGFRVCLSRPPGETEVSELVRLHADGRAEYAADPKRAAEMATRPIGPLPAGGDAVDLAAWTVVANVLLNLDEVVMKR